MLKLDSRLSGHINLLIERYPKLEACKDDIIKSYLIIEECYNNGGKLLIAGNGGSAADSEHIVGELMKSFKIKRDLDLDFKNKLKEQNSEMGKILAEKLQGALPAIALDGHFALSTAYLNDCDPLLCFAQQVNGFGNANDVFFGISTSGNSKNILFASKTCNLRSEY